MSTGQMLGDRYRLDHELAGTSDRPVWVSRDEWAEDDENVLLALVPRSAGPDPAAAATRRVVGREVRIAIGIRSPHVRRVLDVVADDSGLWVAARTRPGSRTLQEVLDGGPRPTSARLARWGRDAASGLADLHEAGLEHRNVRPALVAIDDDGAASLLGVAASGDLASPVTDEDEPGSGDVRALGTLLREALDTVDPDTSSRSDQDRRRAQDLAEVVDLAVDGKLDAARFRDRLTELLESQPTALPVVTPPEAEARTVRVDRDEQTPSDADGPTVRTAPAPHAAPYNGPLWSAARPVPRGPQVPRGPSPHPAQPPIVPPSGPPLVGPHGAPSTGSRTTRTPRTRGRDWVAGHRVLVTCAAIVVALVVIGGLLVAGISGMGPRRASPVPAPLAAPSASPVPAPSTPVSAIGDRRTANPCSMLSTSTFASFGTPRLFDDFGPFGSCAILTNTAAGGSYLTSAGFYAPGEFAPATPTERVGDVAVTRFGAASADRCRRLLTLPDGLTVEVETRAITPAAGTDPCALADAGTSTALPVLVGRSMARRPLDPSLQLGPLNACALLASPALAQVPGLDPSRRIDWFEGWGCSIGYNAALTNAPFANLSFTRTSPLTGSPTRLGRHSAVLTPSPASGTRSAACEVSLVQRSYVGASGAARAEVVQLTVFGATGDPCATATPVAAAVEARLPTPS